MQNGDKYAEIECGLCDGAGRRFDSTNQDKVNVDPRGDRCPRCSGRGQRLILRTSLEQPRFVPSGEPVGEMPDWML